MEQIRTSGLLLICLIGSPSFASTSAATLCRVDRDCDVRVVRGCCYLLTPGPAGVSKGWERLSEPADCARKEYSCGDGLRFARGALCRQGRCELDFEILRASDCRRGFGDLEGCFRTLAQKLAARAILTKNYSTCAQVEEAPFVRRCIEDVAQALGDPAQCKSEACILSIAQSKKSAGPCLLHEQPWLCIQELSLAVGDPTHCQSTPENREAPEFGPEGCIARYALSQLDPRPCQSLKQLRDSCLDAVATNSRNSAACATKQCRENLMRTFELEGR